MRPFASKLPDWAKDATFSDIDVHFGFGDRLKVFFGWNVTVQVSTATQHEIHGKLETQSAVNVWRLPIFRRPATGCVEVPDPAPHKENKA